MKNFDALGIRTAMGFSTEHSAKSRSIGAQEECSPTLRTGAIPAVTYRKTTHPRNKFEGQGWEETTVNDTLNIFDLGETRTPTLVVDQGAGKSSCHIDEEVSPTLSTAHDGAPVITVAE